MTEVFKCIFWESNFELHLCFEMYFLREQLFWFFIYGCWLVWLLFRAYMAAADYFCVFYLYLTLPLSNYFYLFISSHKTLWSNRQDKQHMRLLRMQVQNQQEADSITVKPLHQGEVERYKSNLLSITLLLRGRLGMWAEAHA